MVNNEFTVADVAVSSYLNYVPVFFGSTNPSARPNIVSYMARAASRPAFAKVTRNFDDRIIDYSNHVNDIVMNRPLEMNMLK